MKAEYKIKKMTFKSFDKIVNTSKYIAKNYGIYYIPANALYEIITKSKLRETNNDIADNYIKQYNTVLDKLYKTLIDVSKKNGTTNIPVKNISDAVNLVKRMFDEGMKN